MVTETYTYTVDGLLLSITYTSGEGILSTELMTYRNGYLSEVRLSDGTLIYCHNEENAMGQLTRLSVGNMQRNYELIIMTTGKPKILVRIQRGVQS